MLDNLKATETARREDRLRDANCTRSKDALDRLSSRRSHSRWTRRHRSEDAGRRAADAVKKPNAASLPTAIRRKTTQHLPAVINAGS
jgi:hypothetical protein